MVKVRLRYLGSESGAGRLWRASGTLIRVEASKTLLVSSLEKSSSHGKCEEKGQEDVMSKPSGVHEQENSGSWWRPSILFEIQGPLCLEGAAPSLWGLLTISQVPEAHC